MTSLAPSIATWKHDATCALDRSPRGNMTPPAPSTDRHVEIRRLGKKELEEADKK
jgi:hypothetical protein